MAAPKKPKGFYTKSDMAENIKKYGKRVGGEVTIVPAGAAKEILKKAISTALAKKAKSVTSAEGEKALIKEILNNKQVEKTNLTQKDIAQGLYNFYKKNPKYDTSVKSTMTTPKKPADVVAARIAAERAARAERIRAGVSPAKAKPTIKKPTKVTEKGKATAIARNTETKRQAEIDAKGAPQKQGQTVRGKFFEEPKPGYAGQKLPGKSINAREPKVNPEKPGFNELSAFTKLTDAEKKIFWRADKDAIQSVINWNKKIKDMPKAKPTIDVDKRLLEASKKLTPAQLRKIKAIVAETRRRAGA